MATRAQRLQACIERLGYSFEGPIRGGGDYVPVVVDGTLAHVSGQVPRVGEQVVVTGRVGADVSLVDGRRAAQVCAIRALLLLAQAAGGLERIGRVLRVGVFVQCAPGFTQLSEVADGASALLQEVLGEAGAHARTSVGVFQLPKDAAVELEMTARLVDA